MQGAVSYNRLQQQDGADRLDTGASWREAADRIRAHKQRCRQLPASTPREDERLVAQFLAKRGGATQCPAAYVAPVR